MCFSNLHEAVSKPQALDIYPLYLSVVSVLLYALIHPDWQVYSAGVFSGFVIAVSFTTFTKITDAHAPQHALRPKRPHSSWQPLQPTPSLRHVDEISDYFV